jgi:3-oxoacyl-[acyl-carrier protein] reductase
MIDLSGKLALVTGGSRGIGRATALLFARAGADVAITYHARRAEADDVVSHIESAGRKGTAHGGDQADPQVVRRITAEVIEQHGRIDYFVANAGIWPVEEVGVRDMSDDRWRRTLAVNLDAVFMMTREVLGHMGPGGRVVLISSTAGQRGEAFHADYAATKGAIIAMTKSLAVECAPDITVNSVAPGWVDTEMSWPAFGGGSRSRIEASIPLRRIPPAEDLAGPIVFLCSDLARHITGEILNVNGGAVLCG